ncbi:DUF6708 domain-containing protein [Alloalcanivorax xenomutans]|uniref:DUF6708 domain-containing protein n=1 Tax=Alloalcanivorax xenomutans TaxID=1094342 RepID=UPI001F1DD8C0|nr:DUF6708 domain-containing protein [Alloalcanivorax xenomutans]MCE7525100.1 hypothetical protein [Alloalcanivorax xenomutans]
MAKKTSRLEPQNRHWYEDLPLPGERMEKAPNIEEECNELNEVFLEVSRASSLMRGVFLAFFSFLAPLSLWMLWFLVKENVSDGFSEGGTFLIALSPFFLLAAVLFWGVRMEFNVPLDRPVRFNRKKRKVYLYEYEWKWNPFVRWKTVFKVFDWDNVRAEVIRERGFNGTAYMESHALVLSHCEPGTNKVIDRTDLYRTLGSPGSEVKAMWAYCCHYMEQGLEGLPETKLRPQDVQFARCFFAHYPVLNPTKEGAEYRASGWLHWIYDVMVFPAFPLMLLWGLGYYIVMRLAPDPVWPPEIDRESTSG